MLPDELAEEGDGKIVLLVLDGLGGLPDPESGRTELETAATPNLDRLARGAALGLHHPVGPGIRPGSGPGHLALFGYDPLQWNIGRGVLSALGVGFDLQPGDVAARLNLATFDDEGRVTDRRAGRPRDEENRRLVALLRERVEPPPGVQLFFESEKEHRVVMILRGEGLSAEISDTDPQETGVPAQDAWPLDDDAVDTAKIVRAVLARGRDALSGEERANGLLARGFAAYRRYPGLYDRFKVRSLCIARYPMYRGVARLVGMDIAEQPGSDEESVERLAERLDDYDFVFLHVKAMDSRGEDGDFGAKVAAIEAADGLIPGIERTGPDVLVVTGDHSTPARMRSHSWHPVPILLASAWARGSGADGFGETSCRTGELGLFEAKHIMSLALAHAGRLAKYGA